MPGVGWVYVTPMHRIDVSHTPCSPAIDKDVRGTGNKRNRGAGIMPRVLIPYTRRLTH